ncbi:MATE family efflux transporter [Parabacteroides sp. AD58]|uniref:Multidrug export protein MepA n=1 Tax=Parabacteroides absconsus TaxID=2951805 RepID=A0ABZ2ILP8_9BACT|nr:MATE family efflux transporter [Parabacteroides sp. AD58]MCM6902320.1 MATE family efflux transporter [Parabacteroides sp. AD58]
MSDKNSPLILGTEPIGKLLTQYAIPAIIAMTASSLYNMADSIFIGHGVGPLGIAGLALTFPLMNLAAAFGSLVGVGASTLVSVKLGQKDYDGANNVLGNVFMLNLIMGIAFSVVFLAFLDPVLYFFGASDQTISYARDYMRIILYGNVITHMYLGLNSVLRSSGYPKMAMFATLLSVVVNCLLNPLFIFVLDWGIKGAAWATVFSQLLSLIGQLIHFARPSQLLHFHKGIYKLHKELVEGIISIGMSPFLMNLCSCLIVLLINWGLKEHGGDMAIGAYGIVNRIVSLFAMIIMGFNQGMQPIAGYNYGARQYHRVIDVTKLTTLWGVGVATTGFLICHLFPEFIVGFFTTDEELTSAAVYGLHIVFAVFPIVGFQMVSTNFFLSVGLSRTAIFLSLTRQMLFLVPCLIVLPRIWGTFGVWVSIPIADLTATIVTAIVLIRQFRKFRQQQA